MNSINFIIQKAENLVIALGKDKDLLSPEFELKLNEVLSKLQKYKAFEATSTKKMAHRVVRLLDYLDQGLDYVKINPMTAKRIHERLIRTEKSILRGLKKIEKPPPSKVDCRFAFFSDLDAPDNNGAIASLALDAMRDKIPFITTQSLFLETNNKNKGRVPKMTLQDYMKDHESEWKIYQKGPFLVFLPAQNQQAVADQERLAPFDLLTDGSLSQIALNEVTPPKQKATLKDFFHLFSPKGAKSKLIWIAGHGGVGKPAGLTTEHYKQFLHFITSQHCLGLTISSCSSGGASSLLHLPQNHEEEHINFPVMIRSIGDFLTYSNMEAERKVTLFFDQLEKFLTSQDPKTLSGFKKAILAAEEGKTKRSVNRIQIFIPSAKDSPGGFRSIGEKGNSYSLTFAKMRKEHHLAHQFKTPPLKIKNQKFIDLHPLIIDTPLIFEENDPILLSQIPDQAHHYIESITLSISTLHQFILKTCEFYKKYKSHVSKGFIAGSLQAGATRVNQCALFLHPGGTHILIYRHGDFFYLLDETWQTKKISMFHYLAILNDELSKTKPHDKAVRAQTGGQQSNEELSRSISSNAFWGANTNQYNLLKKLFNPKFISDLTPRSFIDFCKMELEAINFTPEEYSNLAFLLMEHNRTDLARILFAIGKITPNAKDWKGSSLIVSASFRKEHDFVRYLLERGANVNAKNESSGFTALHAAVKEGDTNLVSFLVSHPNIQIDERDKKGAPAIMYGWRKKNIFHILRKKGASLNSEDKTGHTILSQSVFSKLALPVIKELLEAGADPNGGHPSALCWAIRLKNLDIVKLLLEYGANPFLQEKGKAQDFIEAIIGGDPNLIQLFLEHKNFDPNVSDKYENNPLSFAILKNNQNLAQTLIQKGGKLPSSLPAIAKVRNSLEIRSKENDDILIDLLWKFKDLQTNVGKEMIYDLYLRGKQKGVFDAKEKRQERFIKKSMELVCENDTRYGYLLDQLIEIGTDFNQLVGPPFDQKTPLQIAVEKKASKVIERLLKNGADPKDLFPQIIAIGDHSLIALAIEKGAHITPENNLRIVSEYAKVLEIDPKREILIRLLDAGLDIKWEKGAAILLRFIKEGNEEGVRFCFDKGTTLNQNDAFPAFKYAFSVTSLKIVQLLEQKGLKFSLQFVNGDDIRETYHWEGAPFFNFLFAHGFNPANFSQITGDLIRSMIKKEDFSSFDKMLSYSSVSAYFLKHKAALFKLIENSEKKEKFLEIIQGSDLGLFF